MEGTCKGGRPKKGKKDQGGAERSKRGICVNSGRLLEGEKNVAYFYAEKKGDAGSGA